MANIYPLTSNDTGVLAQLFDPESAPRAGILVDALLPSDPNIKDVAILSQIKKLERSIIVEIEATLKETQLSSRRKRTLENAYAKMSSLVERYPTSASVLNNRAQLFRLQYGDDVLVPRISSDITELASAALADLTTAIQLLSPSSPQAAISPAQCQTLAQAHTQRGALYHAASKTLALYEPQQAPPPPLGTVCVKAVAGWTALDFQEAASQDFFLGGRYGNEIGKGLAVHTNPTAKLCGQIVQEAMKREFAPLSPAPL
jgi:hypothetical protein